MVARLTHAAIAFAVTTVLYQAYVLAVSPFVDPPRAVASAEPAPTTVPVARGGARYRELFAAYFPPGHWALGEPRTLDNGQLLAAIDAYQQTDDGKIRVNRCVMLFFPRPRDPSAPPPRDAVVIEAADGALLQLDSPAGLAGGAWGDIQYGQLLGSIEIRSDMSEPGPDDDLRLVTSDLRINDDLIRTNEAVEIQMGPHFARGRKLEIRLLPKERGGEQGGMFAGLESLEISHEVYVQLALAGQSALAPTVAAAASPPGDLSPPAPPAAAAPPLRVQSGGPFSFDFANYVATFAEEVRARQLHPDGTLDQLSADQLNLYFDPATTRSPASAAGAGAAPSALAVRLEPASIEAKGAPFQLSAPSRGASAAGRRLWLELAPRRVTVEGGDEVRLQYRGYEVHAPFVQYQHPPAAAPQQVGALLASGGGWLRGGAEPQDAAEPLEIRWSEQLRLDRRGDRPVLSLWGRPWLSMAGVGQMWADRLEVALRERAPGHVAADAELPWPIAPESLAASGHVAVEAAELTAKTERLDMTFQYEGPAPSAAAEGEAGPLWSPAASQAARPRHYEIASRRLSLTAKIRGDRPQAEQFLAEGDVLLRESTLGPDAPPPLQIAAAQIEVRDAASPDAIIDIRGPTGASSPAQLASTGGGGSLAEIAAEGATIRAPALTIRRSAGEATIDAAGEVVLPLDRDLSGAPLAAREWLTVRWQNSMQLRGDVLEFRGEVVAQHAQGWLQTPRLVVKLTEPVRFDGGSAAQRPAVAAIECWEGVLAEVQQRDAVGPVAVHRVRLENLALDQLTGDVNGSGPGRIESVRLTPAGAVWAPGETSDDASATGQRLRFLGIDFVRGVVGNLHRREVELQGSVRAVDGPVDAWEQRLEMQPTANPGPQTVWITSDALSVAESPTAAILRSSHGGGSSLGPVELTAAGHVVIEGEEPRRGAFTARGDRASYDQSKEMFVLEGNGAESASITHQPYPGAPFSTSAARKLSYDRRTGDVKVAGVSRMEWNQVEGAGP